MNLRSKQSTLSKPIYMNGLSTCTVVARSKCLPSQPGYIVTCISHTANVHKFMGPAQKIYQYKPARRKLRSIRLLCKMHGKMMFRYTC